MITRQDAETVAAGWARREGLRGGYACEPVVDEFDLGFVVYTTRPPAVRSEPGAFPKAVIDRETGRMSTWPSVPSPAVQELYRAQRATVVGPPKAADPAVQLRREADRRVSPSVAAHLTLDGRLFIARGAKGDQEIRHHPLIAQWLAGQPAGHPHRGVERHAELLVTSDALLEVDRVRAEHGYGPVTLDEAREVLRQAGFETFHIREEGDPLGGTPAEPCGTCARALVNLAVLPYEELRLAFDWPADMFPAPQYGPAEGDPTGRFPEPVAVALLYGSWSPHMREYIDTLIRSVVQEAGAATGLEHSLELHAAAFDFLCEFTPVHTSLQGPGLAHRIVPIEIDPRPVAWSADMLAEFGTRIGARLYPVGQELKHSMLAVDERGRMFAFDQAGEWFVGENGDAAMTALLTGAPMPRVRDDGTW